MPYPVENGDPLTPFHVHRYKERLNQWAVVRILTEQDQMIVARCRSRSDADGHLEVLQRQFPHDRFSVVFDYPIDPSTN